MVSFLYQQTFFKNSWPQIPEFMASYNNICNYRGTMNAIIM